MFLERKDLIEKMSQVVKINTDFITFVEFVNNLTDDAIMHLSYNTWIMNDEQYEKYYQSNFSKISQASITNFDDRDAKPIIQNRKSKPTIIKEISTIKFTELLTLSLAGNKIVSIEYLQHLYAPKLKSLKLNQNLITNMRPLARCNFPELTNLQIYLNYTTFSVEYQSGLYYHYPSFRIQSNTIYWLFKMHAPRVSYICINRFDRVDLNFYQQQKLKDKFDELVRQRLLS